MSATDSGKTQTILTDQHGHKADIFPDGSLKVSIVSVGPGTVQNYFGEANGVVADDLVSILTVVSLDIELSKIEFDCENVATFSVWVNEGAGFAKIAEKGTGFGSELNGVFDFSTGNKSGLRIPAGHVLQVRGVHKRPAPARFTARVLGIVL